MEEKFKKYEIGFIAPVMDLKFDDTIYVSYPDDFWQLWRKELHKDGPINGRVIMVRNFLGEPHYTLNMGDGSLKTHSGPLFELILKNPLSQDNENI